MGPIAFFQQNSLILLLSLAAAGTFLWLLCFRERLRIPWYTALVLSVLHVAIGVICVKAFAVLEGNPLEKGAMSLFGAVFFLPLVYWLGARLFKRSTADVFDIFAVCMIFTLMLARVNCLITGCCLGRQISFAPSLRWPTRELELAYYFFFLLWAAPRVRKKESCGKVYPLYLISYGIVRAVLEFFRVSSSGRVFHLSHLWAFLALAIGLGFYGEMNRRNHKQNNHERVK